MLLGDGESRYEPWGSSIGAEGGFWFSSWYVVSIDTGHIAQSPQFGTRWSPALKKLTTEFEGGNRQNRLHLESKTSSWAGLWTFELYAQYLWKRHINWKTRPLTHPN